MALLAGFSVIYIRCRYRGILLWATLYAIRDQPKIISDFICVGMTIETLDMPSHTAELSIFMDTQK